jgi:hypothetical protein
LASRILSAKTLGAPGRDAMDYSASFVVVGKNENNNTEWIHLLVEGKGSGLGFSRSFSRLGYQDKIIED